MDRTDSYCDLDELVVRCRPSGARDAFAEAVACYRAGAFRAAITATWTAVVFDYLSKLRDLDLEGNSNAKIILDSFESARKNNDWRLSLQLERDILKDANDKFELLNSLEMEDLDRLRTDRNRAAHPSLLTIEEPYAPPAELARCHLRNAATHMLSRPPIQGKEAWNRVWADVTSIYFPEDVAKAAEVLGRRLPRPRITLVKKLLIETVKRILEPSGPHEARRFTTAVGAIVRLYYTEAATLLRDKLPTLVDAAGDSALHSILNLSANVPLCWDSLQEFTRGKLKKYCKTINYAQGLADAIMVPDLRSIVESQNYPIPVVAEAACQTRDPIMLDKVVAVFEKSRTYTEFRDVRGVLRDKAAISAMSLEQIRRLVGCLGTNSYLREYTGYSGVVGDLIDSTKSRHGDLREPWAAVFSVLPLEGQSALAIEYPELSSTTAIDPVP